MKLYNNLKKLYDNLKKLDDRLNNIDDKLNNMDDRLNKIDDGLKEIDDKLKNKSKDNLNKNFNKVYKNVFPPKVKTKTNANSAVKKQIGTFMAFGSKYADKITNEDTEEGIKTDVLKNLTLDNGKEIPKYIVNALVKGIVYSDYIMPDPKVYGKSKFAGFILSILTIFAFSPVAISVYKLFKPDSIAQPVIVLCSTGIALMSIIEKTSGWKINGESNYKIISCLKNI